MTNDELVANAPLGTKFRTDAGEIYEKLDASAYNNRNWKKPYMLRRVTGRKNLMSGFNEDVKVSIVQ